MQTLFILEYQANNDGSCAATAPLGYTDPSACLSAYFTKCAAAVQSTCDTHTVMIVDSLGQLWQGHKQILRHGKEPEPDAEA